MDRKDKLIGAALLALILVGASAFFYANRISQSDPPRPHIPLPSTAKDKSIEVSCVLPEKKRRLEEWKNHPELPDKLRAVSYEICDEWIRVHFTVAGLSDQLISLRNSLDDQKDNATGSFRSAYTALQRYQLLIISLGFLATILTGWASRLESDASRAKPPTWHSPRNVSFIAMIVTALITSLTTMGEFYDFRGSAVRNWTVRSAMAALHSEIDGELKAIVTFQEMPDMKTKIAQWEERRGKILQDAGTEWSSFMRAGK